MIFSWSTSLLHNPLMQLRMAGLVALSVAVTSCQRPVETPPPAVPDSPHSDNIEEVVATPDVLTLIYSRSPVTLNPHLATGFQDFEAARIVYEPLASYGPDGKLIPILAAKLPSLENGDVSEDGLSVTWRLQETLRWSDGEPLTAKDVVFTYKFITNPAVAAVTAQYYRDIESIKAEDDHTVKITFKQPIASWQTPFTGLNGLILPEHLFKEFNNRKAREAPANFQPVGTGPYRYLTKANDRLLFAPNELYRQPGGNFKRVEILGDVPPYVAARDVLRDGTADFAHNIQLESAALVDLVQTGETGTLMLTFGSQVERIMLNFADPNRETEAKERASQKFPHPILKDLRVRQAIDYGIDRQAIVVQLYGDLGKPTSQLLVAPNPSEENPITYKHDVETARALLEEAGWVDSDGDGIRDRNNQPLQLIFQTSIGTIRQATQNLVKEQLAEIGIDILIERVRAEDFFSADPDQTRSINHFYADMQEYAIGNDIPDPIIYMGWWTCDNIAALSNNWQKPNNARYCDPAYDELWEAARGERDAAKRNDLFRQMERKLADDVAVLPIVHRALSNAVSDRITGYTFTSWDASTWDIANWRPVEPTTETETEATSADAPTDEEPENNGPAKAPEAEVPVKETESDNTVDSTPGEEKTTKPDESAAAE
ncbi:peptide ABC transporter substrate-binding protein [Leptothoe spongobia]|uniref:Peptide ABC transporter substrate-binding protein n=1 Tax=Leptothoe spongobia TAU-MAC 1115 TaxID=1967444 RepID=A0A947GLY8_9CYAN|nr:peptide ABC transporter substrate-binding protein [Leptothoe spongobia]MBT9317653.1 peptide ABC transporter substrate-binding protein [Leptothoe spongobia TAU-MAC 1115]